MAMLGDAVVQTLPFLRAQAESLMVSTCAVLRPAGAPVTDPDTGAVTTPSDQVYSGRCRVQTYEAYEANSEVGSAIITTQRYMVHLPIGSYAPEEGDVIEMVSSPADPYLVGRKYRVVALLHKTLATAYRLGVQEVL